MKEILLYGGISDFSVASMIKNMRQAERENEGIELLVNTQGGNPLSMWGVIAEFKRFPLAKKITVHGEATSAGAYFLIFNKDNEAIEQSIFTLHRAFAVVELWGEEPNETTKKDLLKINEDLRSGMEASIDVSKFEEIAGVNLDRFFDITQPIVDVTINAQQAKDIGLIKKIISLTPQAMGELNTRFAASAARGYRTLNSKSEMTIEQLKKDHPEVFKSVKAEGFAEGVASSAQGADKSDAAMKAEKDRVGAWMAYKDLDPERVFKGIESGEHVSTKDEAEIKAAAIKAQLKAEMKGADDINGQSGDDDEDDDKKEVFAKALRSKLGLK